MPLTVDDLDLPGLLAVAAQILDEAVPEFLDGLGAPSAISKGGTDFATEMDLALERRIGGALREHTGIGVHGEEFGGAALDAETVWVVDPIDGTFNYSTGLPMTAMLAALVVHGEPVIGLTWVPRMGQRFAAYRGGPLLIDGEPVPPLAPRGLGGTAVGYVSYQQAARGSFPGAERVRLQNAIAGRRARVRIHGSTGIDMAYVAAGYLSGAISFGHNAWDHAAGVALVRAAGGVATDLYGRPWTVSTPSLVTGGPGAHTELMELIDAGDWPDRPVAIIENEREQNSSEQNEPRPSVAADGKGPA